MAKTFLNLPEHGFPLTNESCETGTTKLPGILFPLYGESPEKKQNQRMITDKSGEGPMIYKVRFPWYTKSPKRFNDFLDVTELVESRTRS